MGKSRAESRPRGCWPVAGCVSAILIFSVALAYASPPDPSWVPGVYDDRDGDDVIGMVTEGSGVNDSRGLPCVECVLVGFVLRAATGRIPYLTVHRQTIRGPPPIESADAPVDLLLTSLATASRPPNIPLIQSDQLSRVEWFCSARASPLSPSPSACWPWFAMHSTSVRPMQPHWTLLRLECSGNHNGHVNTLTTAGGHSPGALVDPVPRAGRRPDRLRARPDARRGTHCAKATDGVREGDQARDQRPQTQGRPVHALGMPRLNPTLLSWPAKCSKNQIDDFAPLKCSEKFPDVLDWGVLYEIFVLIEY